MVDIDSIRRLAQEKGLRITSHASFEGLKDDISAKDMRYALFHGKIIERYPERPYPNIETVLIYARLPSTLPIHIVVDVILREGVVVVTTYVPDRKEWIDSQKRRKRPKL